LAGKASIIEVFFHDLEQVTEREGKKWRQARISFKKQGWESEVVETITTKDNFEMWELETLGRLQAGMSDDNYRNGHFDPVRNGPFVIYLLS